MSERKGFVDLPREDPKESSKSFGFRGPAKNSENEIIIGSLICLSQK